MIHQRKKYLYLTFLFAGLNLHTATTYAQSQAEVNCMMAVVRSCTWRLCRGDINCLDDATSLRCARHSEFTCIGPDKNPAAIAAREEQWLTQALSEDTRRQGPAAERGSGEPGQPRPEKTTPAYTSIPGTRQASPSPPESETTVEPWNTVNDVPCGNVSFKANRYDCPEGYPQYILTTSNSCHDNISWRGAYYGSDGRAVEVVLDVPPGGTQTHAPCCYGPYHKHLQCMDSAQGAFE